MSDVNAAASSMGVPAEIVRRSAEARATASGLSAEEILSAWGGGGSVTAPAPAHQAATPEALSTAPDAIVETLPTPAPGAQAPAAPAVTIPAAPVPVSSQPPILVGARDNPWAVVIGALGLFLAVVLVGLVGPALQTDIPGARSGVIPFSAAAEIGRDLYNSLGCAGCHTQMVRPIVADVGLGPVTLADTNQVLGTRRFGPDLAEVGARLSGTQMEAIVAGSAGHPPHSLSSDDMSDLTAYLLESATVGPPRSSDE